jgi:signal transduction histidine kinase
VLFRVALEALINVERHAKATTVTVGIHKVAKTVCMRIEDDGRSFLVQRVLHARGGKRLGLVGMRERLEMVGGSLDVQSAPSKGTTILTVMPLGRLRRVGASTTAAAN